jgi:baculoviral IAP repeat-containing protein 6
MKLFEEMALEKAKIYFDKVEEEENLLKIIRQFSLSAGSQFPPLAAFMGGYISQEIIKAITNKYFPTK